MRFINSDFGNNNLGNIFTDPTEQQMLLIQDWAKIAATVVIFSIGTWALIRYVKKH
jgi:hypothetical protein